MRLKGLTDGAEFGDLLYWSTVTGAVTASTVQKRSGSYSYRTVNSSNLVKAFDAPLSEFYWRGAFYSTATGGTLDFVRMRTSTNTTFRVDFESATSKLLMYVGGSLVVTTTATFPQGAWYVMELYCKHDATVGEFTMKIDDAVVGTYSGNTSAVAANSEDFRIGGSNGLYWDDFAVNDTTGSVNNSWCGLGKVLSQTLRGDGSTIQLTGSDGNQVNNYLLVNERPSDSDTTFVWSSGAGLYDTYLVSPLTSTSVSIVGIFGESRSRAYLGSGSQSFVFVTPSGTMETDPEELTAVYARYVTDFYPTDPVGGQTISPGLLGTDYEIGPKMY